MIKQNDNQNGQKPTRPLLYYYSIAMIAVLLINWFLLPIFTEPKTHLVEYSDFMTQVGEGNVKEVTFLQDQIIYVVEEGETEVHYKTGWIDDPAMLETLKEKGITFGKEIPAQPNFLLMTLLSYGIPILIFFYLGRRLSRSISKKMGPDGLMLGAEAGKIYVPSADKKTFDDVAGQDEAKEALGEIIDYLEKPDKYLKIGAQCPKGILLVGPPGTGKTLMAKAVAGEAGVPFFSISGSEFVEMFVGRGAAKVRELFDQANKKAPCIVFIDEIDTIGKKRDTGFSTNDEREQTLNQLLTEMDGFEVNNGVIILAATNRPEVLDPALLRPGRFDRQIRVELPDLQGRIAILKVHAKKYIVDEAMDYEFIARAMAGASGAQIANIVNEGALRAVRLGHDKVTQEDLEESIEVVIAGQQKKSDILSSEEKRIVSTHEVGHALVAALQTHSAPVHKITIIPRTSGALGYTMQVEESEKFLQNKTELFHQIVTLAGGRAAEEVVFGEITTGASNDIEKMTKLARAMVTRFGMSDQFGMMALETRSNQYLGGDASLSCSERTGEMIDQEVLSLIQTAYQEAVQLLEKNRELLEEITQYLLEKETISGEEFMEIFNAAKA